MAGSAKRLEPIRVKRVLAGLALHRFDVVAFEPSGPTARDTTPSVARENKSADDRPAASIQRDVVVAHALLSDDLKTQQIRLSQPMTNVRTLSISCYLYIA